MADIKVSTEEQHENHNWDEHVIEDDDEHHVKAEENKQEVKVEPPKEVYKKDKHGNILITSLGEYIEPTKIVKGAHAGDLASNTQYEAFKNATVYESDDEEEIKGYDDGLDELLNLNKQNEKKTKNQKLKPKKGEDDGLDDLLKEFGIETVQKKEEPKKKEGKPKVEKPKVEKVENEKEEAKKKEEEEKKKPEKEKKPEKKVTTKSHINDAKKEILKKQEELKKKEKKKGM